MEDTNLEKDKKRLESKIEEIKTKVEKYPKPEELEEIKKEIKRSVPFTRRLYFAAMLLKESLESKGEGQKEKKETLYRVPSYSSGKKPQKESEGKKRELPAGANTLYMNIGRMKSLNRTELINILDKEAGIKKERVYDIKIHDKYTFIILSEEDCQKAIDSINGKDINGRIVKINIARDK